MAIDKDSCESKIHVNETGVQESRSNVTIDREISDKETRSGETVGKENKNQETIAIQIQIRFSNT